MAATRAEKNAVREIKWKDFKDQEHRVRSARAEEGTLTNRRDDRGIAAMEREANITTRVLKEKRQVIDFT